MHHLGLNPFSLQALYWLGCGGYSGEGHRTKYFALLFHCVVKPRTNGHILANNVPILLDVTCCVRLYTLLYVVACRCVLLKLLRKVWNQSNFQLQTFLLFRDRRHMVSKLLWVVSSLRCTAGPTIVVSYCIRLHTTVTDGRNNSQHCWPNNVKRLELLPQFARSFMLKNDKNSERNVTKGNV